MLICTLVPYHTGYRLKRIRLDQPRTLLKRARFVLLALGMAYLLYHNI